MAPFATLFFFLFVLQVARVVEPSETFNRALGSSVDLAIRLPKGAAFEMVTLHSLTLRKGVAMWAAGRPLQVLSPQFSKRVTLVEEARAFRIQNLGLADTGHYGILMQTSEQSFTLRSYMLFVFNVTVSATRLANSSSCGLDLQCEVGLRGTRYSWKNATSGETLSRGGYLHLVLRPENSQDSYTCTAQASVGQGSLDVTPYLDCPPQSGATGYLTHGLQRLPCLLGAALVALGPLL